MTEQTIHAAATPADMKVDVKSLPAKRPIKKESAQRKAQKAARVAYKDFKKRVRKVLTNTFHVSSMLDFALKFDALKEHNIGASIQKAQFDCLSVIINRKNLSPAVKAEASALFNERVNKAREFNPDPEKALEIIFGKKAKIEKVLSTKEKKTAKKDKPNTVEVKAEKPKKEAKAKKAPPKDKKKKSINNKILNASEPNTPVASMA